VGAEKRRDLKAQFKEARRRLLEHLKGKGLRWTRQRDVILENFIAAQKHISAQELYELVKKSSPEIGYATVYRCLNLFVDVGIAKERRFDEERVRYESAIFADHHDHLICTECGTIVEFEDERIEKLQDLIASGHGFAVTNHRLELYGKCPKCS